MAINFDDSLVSEKLYPFTSIRNAADIRVGILTIREKWELLQQKKIVDLLPGQTLLANLIPTKQSATIVAGINNTNDLVAGDDYKILNYPWQIFQLNDWAIRKDFELITNGRQSESIPSSNHVVASGNIFVEPGAVVSHSILNASTGPIYIGKNAEIMEGCIIRGPFALCEGSVLKMGAKVYGATTIGPYSTAGGEIKNTVMFAYSNKGHDGYLGDSVLGEWCNLGAGTSNSNVLNTAAEVKVWQNDIKAFTPVGLKCGLLMGDYSRAAINTSFNTGTTVGLCCNIFADGFPPKLVTDFSWGKEKYIFEKALKDIDNWKKLKGQGISEKEKEVLKHLYTSL
ncbi:MAG: putative sugar nucleotidyl transferase [Ferruginibacter sp.]